MKTRTIKLTEAEAYVVRALLIGPCFTYASYHALGKLTPAEIKQMKLYNSAYDKIAGRKK